MKKVLLSLGAVAAIAAPTAAIVSCGEKFERDYKAPTMKANIKKGKHESTK